ncbi:MAG: calcium-translocating P-type ATPase, PMCA-type [Clostridia bacterium]|nr:calcium-translocating P-type ATPase, PMCA-type [Clostridia bacterium]
MTGNGGLSAGEVHLSRQQHGSNCLEKQSGSSLLSRFLEGFSDPIIRILLIALCINIVFMLRGAPWFETAGIAVAVFLATFVSALSEYGSDAAFQRMQAEAAAVTCRVRRDGGTVFSIPADEIVCGDLVLLQAGESVPADGFLREGKLDADQSALTGESREIHKTPESEQSSLLRGSVIVSGEGLMEVTAVGSKTMYGSMAKQMQEEPRESPLHVRLDALAGTISKFGIAAALLVAASDLFLCLFVQNGLSQGFAAIFQHILHAVTLAVTVLVVAVPEGLPMMITVVLSSNMVRMMRDHVLVRRLTGIETAGSMNILFTDKTGTLTCGRMTAELIFTGDGTRFDNMSSVQHHAPALFQQLYADCRYNSGGTISAGSVTGGNATDRALLYAILPMAAGEASISIGDKVPFDSRRKFAAVRLPSRALTLVRGAPEILLPHCTQFLSSDGMVHPLSREIPRKILQEQAMDGGRVIAMAITDHAVTAEQLPFGLTLTALLVLRDPVRRETPQAVHQLKTAGISTIMLTGDHPDTARAVARRCGVLSDRQDIVVESSQLAAWSDRELEQRLPNLAVVARAMPSDKVRLVQAAQRLGLVAGMTGDGVNDAPALKLADVGFAMGSGTAVAKEAGDIVITDDNLASIARAVLYGRTIFKSIRKFLVFQLTMNVCAVGVSIAGPLIGIDTPVTVMQMLWINLIMDTLAGLAFSGEPPLKEYMQEEPKHREEPVLNSYMKGQIVFTGVYTIILCILFLWAAPVRRFFCYAAEPLRFLTAFFALFIFCGIFNAFNARTHRLNLLAHIWKNPLFVLIMIAVSVVQLALIYFGGALFRTTPLPFFELGAAAVLASTVIPVDFGRKLWLRMRGKERNF